MQNSGKIFESDFMKSIPSSVFCYRIHDTGGIGGSRTLRFTQKNLCDFILFYKSKIYLIELKSHKGKSIPFDRFTQLNMMIKQRLENVIPLFIVNFADVQKTYIMKAQDIAELKKERKSLSLAMCEEYGYGMDQWLLRSHWRYDLSALDKIADIHYF